MYIPPQYITRHLIIALKASSMIEFNSSLYENELSNDTELFIYRLAQSFAICTLFQMHDSIFCPELTMVYLLKL
jgi:hypothetical protein